MTFQRRASSTSLDQIQPTPTLAQGNDSKSGTNHYEDVENHAEMDVDDKMGPSPEIQDSDAKGYVDPNLIIDDKENIRLRRMINWRQVGLVLPIMCMVYMTQALDKGALGPVSIMGWLEDVNAQGQDFAMTSTLMWIGIICGEPLANQLVRRCPTAKILAGSMFIWTALLFGLAFTFEIPPVLANRFLLGFSESVFGPCLLAITVQWYRRSEQPFVTAIWQSMSALATSVASLYGWGFYQVPEASGLKGWQWVILALAIGSFISSTLTWFLLPDSPTKVKWADDATKTKFVERVRCNDQGIKQKKWKSDQAWEVVKDPYTYCLFFLALFQTMIVGGIGKFNSLLINRAFGFDVLTSQLLKIPLSFIGVSFYMLMAFVITKWNQTLFAMIGFTIINMAGTVVLITVTPSDSTRVGLFIAFNLMQAFAAVNPAIFLMLSRNSAGSTKKSFTYALTCKFSTISYFMGWASGNAIAPQLFWADWAPRYINSLYIHLALYCCFIFIILGTRVLLIRRNKKKIAAQTAADGTVINTNSHAFDDLTDLANPDFRYSV